MYFCQSKFEKELVYFVIMLFMCLFSNYYQGTSIIRYYIVQKDSQFKKKKT